MDAGSPKACTSDQNYTRMDEVDISNCSFGKNTRSITASGGHPISVADYDDTQARFGCICYEYK